MFPGNELDCQNSEMHLLADKLQDLRQEVANWQRCKAATKQQLLSLIGHLGHTTKVVILGRIFLYKKDDRSFSQGKAAHHWVHLNQEFQSNLLWWKLFLTKFQTAAQPHFPGASVEHISSCGLSLWT